MAHFGTILLILPLVTGSEIVSGQNPGPSTNVQSFLNNFCIPGAVNNGCDELGIIPADAGVPLATPAPGLFPFPDLPDQPAPICTENEQICPQLKNVCVPNDINCDIINSGTTCRIPDDYGVVTQVLVCGDGTPAGVRCGANTKVPVLTMLLVQCQGSNSLNQRPVSSLDVLAGPGDDGGAGVYRCSAAGSWDPHSQSPFITQLTVSCRNVACGRVPHPSRKMPIHRSWAWVRAIYKYNKLHCTATLVSSKAVVTAAHCLTRSIVSNDADTDLSKYQLELPGPHGDSPRIKVEPESIYIHPRYNFNNGKQEHDLAIMFFKYEPGYNFPTVCITDRPHSPTRGKTQVVFSLQEGQSSKANEVPKWRPASASWDHTCITTANRFNGGCIDQLRVQQAQFCATHEGVSMTKGSSGGPYLAEVGEEIEEVWVLMGVLASFNNASSCLQDHSVYGQVADDSRWIKDCVFDKACNSFDIRT